MLQTMCISDVQPMLRVDGPMLSDQEIAQFDRDGFLNLGQLITPETARRMADRLDEIAQAEGEAAGKDFHTEQGTTRLGSLLNKDPMFDLCFLHPKVLAAVNEVTLGNFGLSSLTARTAHPGEGSQALHCDWTVPDDAPPGMFAANVLWVLDDFTETNGPTRLIPGSHRRIPPTREQADAKTVHADEIRLIVPAGTVVVINAFLWHGGTTNRSLKPRHLVSAMFQPRGFYQSIAYRRLHESAARRLSPAAKFIADHDE